MYIDENFIDRKRWLTSLKTITNLILEPKTIAMNLEIKLSYV